MKKLLLLRGAPASGKSTFIKDNNLEPYVISSDNLRLMVAGLSMDLDGNMKTSQDLSKNCSKKFGTHLMTMTSTPLKTSRNRTTAHSSLRYVTLMTNTSSTSMRTISTSSMLFLIPTILLVLLLTHSSHKQSYSK